MRYMILAIAACGLAAGCSVKSERTVVERPAVVTPAPASAAVVYSDPAPAPTSTTVYVAPGSR